MFLIESNIKLLLEQIIATFALYNFINQYEARYFSFLTVHTHKRNSIYCLSPTVKNYLLEIQNAHLLKSKLNSFIYHGRILLNSKCS